MPSLASRALSAYARLVVRRRDWGDERALVHRARRLLGAPRVMQWLVLRGLVCRPLQVPGVRGEWVMRPDVTARAPQGVLLYVHGGGYVSGSAADRRLITAALARATGFHVLGLDYRLAPEHRCPAALDDVAMAWDWLMARGTAGAPVVVAGESAGGGLALLLAQRARDTGRPLPACVVVLSPWTDLAATGASLAHNDGRCALFHAENIPAFARVYLGAASGDDPRASPLYGAARGLPPVLMQVGSTEVLLDDACRMHERIRAAGGTSVLRIYDDVMHGWQLMAPFVPEARRAVAEIAEFVRAHAAPP
jgi:monoterpene epsilon-lactone hydrolase